MRRLVYWATIRALDASAALDFAACDMIPNACGGRFLPQRIWLALRLLSVAKVIRNGAATVARATGQVRAA